MQEAMTSNHRKRKDTTTNPAAPAWQRFDPVKSLTRLANAARDNAGAANHVGVGVDDESGTEPMDPGAYWQEMIVLFSLCVFDKCRNDRWQLCWRTR